MLGQFRLRQSSAVAVRRARVVAGQFSPVWFPDVGPCVTPTFAEASPRLSAP
jgi:hypothetical protein